MSQNLIPAVWAKGSFEAENPFSNVVDPKVFYTVEAVRTIPEMQAEKEDLYKLIFEPVGITQDQYQSYVDQAIANNAVVIVLTSRGRPDTYLLSTYLKSFPLVDGVIYERVCIISDLGACPPAFKDRINSVIAHFNEYIKNAVGIQDPRTVIGTIPTRGYVSKEQADAWENTRQQTITRNPSDVVRIEELTTENQQLYTYINQLEAQLKAKNP
ncbi:hypothetical protein YUBABA_01210 [Serratia phage vB_SmaM-Yubaba]|nr:hypothetical protein SUREIYA_01150 [Serratia phage vB_SmaM-Sureiya]UQT03327.1 hypothetical protein YUBABA_01210 [Serratia phage vB_SmaM-Yubaba]